MAIFDFSSSDTVDVSERVARQVSSIGQDIVYCTGKGSVKPPKHLTLPMAFRHLTGSAQVIGLLNRFGHGVAYSQVLELDTALAVANVSEEKCCDSFIPQNIDLSRPAIFCYDNNDLQEETLAGSGTTHCTNGIIVQRSLPDSEVLMCRQSKPAEQSMHSCKRQRSFHVYSGDAFTYSGGRRCGPAVTSTEIPDQIFGVRRTPRSAEELAFVMARLSSTCSQIIGRDSDSPQTVSGWSGFNVILHEHDIHSRSIIG